MESYIIYLLFVEIFDTVTRTPLGMYHSTTHLALYISIELSLLF